MHISLLSIHKHVLHFEARCVCRVVGEVSRCFVSRAGDSEALLKKRELARLARDLVVNHKVKHSTLQNITSGAIKKAAAALPRLDVVYNTIYGGFGYSKAFWKFKTSKIKSRPKVGLTYQTSCEEDERWRIDDVPLIREFGKHVAEKWPQLGDLAYLHCHYRIGEIEHSLKYFNTGRFSFQDLMQFAPAEVLRGLIPAAKKGTRYEDVHDLTTFYESVEKYGPYDVVIWKHQHTVNSGIMTYFARHSLAAQLSVRNQACTVAAQQMLGLLAASGSFVSLDIRSVRQLVHWLLRNMTGKRRYVKVKQQKCRMVLGQTFAEQLCIMCESELFTKATIDSVITALGHLEKNLHVGKAHNCLS